MDQKFDITQSLFDFDKTRLLLSLKHYLVTKDITLEKDSKKRVVKKDWLNLWKSKVEIYLKDFYENVYENETTAESLLITDEILLKRHVSLITDEGITDDVIPYIFILELSLFSPYYEIWDGDDFSLDGSKSLLEKFSKRIGRFKKTFYKSLYPFNRKAYLNNVKLVASEMLKIDSRYVDTCLSTYETALKNNYKNCDSGMYGVSTLGTTLTNGSYYQNLDILLSPEFMASQAARLEVALIEIILKVGNDLPLAINILKRHSDEASFLYIHTVELRLSDDYNKALIKDAEESLEIIDKSLKSMEQNIYIYKKRRR